MKGRITCPKCGHHIIAEINKEVPSFTLDCPKCNRHFKVKTSQVDLSNIPPDSTVEVEADCDWEEHGEPRKTILSSIKPRTDKPMIASLLLISVVIIGIVSAFFPTLFLQAPVQIASLGGINGGLTIFVDNESVVDSQNLLLNIDQEDAIFERDNNSFHASDLTLGKHVLTIRLNSSNSSSTFTTKQVYILPFDLSTGKITVTNTNPIALENSSLELAWLSGILLLLSGVTLIGALTSWKRRFSDVALIGSIVGIFSIGIYFSALILSIIAFWLILKSRDEFDDGKKGKSF
jgi:hypothetical protein